MHFFLGNLRITLNYILPKTIFFIYIPIGDGMGITLTTVMWCVSVCLCVDSPVKRNHCQLTPVGQFCLTALHCSTSVSLSEVHLHLVLPQLAMLTCLFTYSLCSHCWSCGRTMSQSLWVLLRLYLLLKWLCRAFQLRQVQIWSGPVGIHSGAEPIQLGLICTEILLW